MGFGVTRIITFIFVIFSTGNLANANDNIELLNSTLITKLHLDASPDRAQMLAAYQVSFRNKGDAPLEKVTILLNPGLQVSKVLGAGGRKLQTRNRNAHIAGREPLRLNAVDITLASPLKHNSRREIVIHYAGSLEDLSLVGLPQSREVLHPTFTMLRAQGFAYPVFARPEMQAIEAAWHGKPFHQVAFVEVNGNQKVVGNLAFAEKTINSGKTNFELKSTQPTGPLALAIGDYDIGRNSGISTAYRGGQSAAATNIATAVQTYAHSLTRKLGAPKSDAMLTILSVPDGYGSGHSEGLIYVEDSMFDAATLTGDTDFAAKVRGAVRDMWLLNPSHSTGHWANGVDRFILASNTPSTDILVFKEQLFGEVLALEAQNEKLGKTPLTDFTIEGFDAEADIINTLAFAVLHDLLGDEGFWGLTRQLRADLSAGYTDTSTVLDFLDRTLENRSAKKFVTNWFEKGRMGKDLAKAKTYAELVKRYR